MVQKQVQRETRDGLLREVEARSRHAATTPNSFAERWHRFWANHFTVAARNAQVIGLVGPFEREAIRANVFDEINVTSNDSSSPRPLIRLTRHQHQYILDFHNPTTLNPNEETFLRDILAELPPKLFGRTALFCTRTCAWTAFL